MKTCLRISTVALVLITAAGLCQAKDDGCRAYEELAKTIAEVAQDPRATEAGMIAWTNSRPDNTPEERQAKENSIAMIKYVSREHPTPQQAGDRIYRECKRRIRKKR
jgi:hypothetical protein